MGTYNRTIKYDEALPNFLASEVGLRLVTMEISDSGVSADAEGRKVVKAGTVYPTNDASAKGIVFKDVDVTYGPRDGSVMIAGRILKNRFTPAINSGAETPLKASGIYFEEMPETTRP